MVERLLSYNKVQMMQKLKKIDLQFVSNFYQINFRKLIRNPVQAPGPNVP